MNRFIKSVAIGVALGCAVLWCVPGAVNAQTKRASGNIEVASGGTWGSSGPASWSGRLSSEALRSAVVGVPAGKTFRVYINCDKGLAADGDSVSISIETRPEGSPNTPTSARSWTFLGGGVSTADSTDYPISFYFMGDMDSTQQTANGSIDGGGTIFRRGVSLGEVRISLNGPVADSLADAAGRWPWIITWD